MNAPSAGFRNEMLLAIGATLFCAIVGPLRKYTLLVGIVFLILLFLRYQRTGGQ